MVLEKYQVPGTVPSGKPPKSEPYGTYHAVEKRQYMTQFNVYNHVCTFFLLFAHSSCTSLYILLFIKSTVYCIAHFILLHILPLIFFLFYFILTYIYIYSLVLCIIFIFLHCPLSGPVLIYISLLIISCIIEYMTNKRTFNLSVSSSSPSWTLVLCPGLWSIWNPLLGGGFCHSYRLVCLRWPPEVTVYVLSTWLVVFVLCHVLSPVYFLSPPILLTNHCFSCSTFVSLVALV